MCEHVWQHGSFIANWVSGSCTVCLYHMVNLLAEVWYHRADNKIHWVRGFKSMRCLDHT